MGNKLEMTINMSCTAEKEREDGEGGKIRKRFMLRNLLSEYGGKLTGWEFKEGMTLVIE